MFLTHKEYHSLMNLRAAVNSIFAITGFRFIEKENYEALKVDPR
jgi:hypothetical protein